MKVSHITVQRLKELFESNAEFHLIDVREPDEHAKSRIEPCQLVPLGTLPDAIKSWDKDAYYVMQCHSGMRSAHAAAHMMREGFTRVDNLEGGIVAWEEAYSQGVH